jgi:antitoxin (DNA-binding transcriptional repressor) of toxin-antitoxin stability system
VIIVTRRGKPVAQLGPTEEPVARPVFGSTRGRIEIGPDFDEPLEDMAEYMS